VTVETLGVVGTVLIGAWTVTAFLFRARLFPTDLHVVPRDGIVDPYDVGAGLVTTALLVLVVLGVSSPARVLLALAFVTFVPGWAALGLVPPLKLVTLTSAVVARVPLVEGTAKVAMAVALSLAACTAASQALVWLQLWYPSVLLGVLGGLSLLALAVRAAWPRRFSALSLDLR
jgi:hypothetical protein